MAKALNILVVDDSRVILNRLFQQLNELEVVSKVAKANNFQKALEVLAQEQIDVALLDINLPGKNGIDLLGYITQHHPLIKAIMVTNQGSDYYRNICAEMGSFGFIDKTQEIEELPTLIYKAAS